MNFSDIVGEIFSKIEKATDNSEILFYSIDGGIYKMYHSQDCCESVVIDDICGDLNDLLNSPILKAEESTSDTNPVGVTKDYQDSFTWTFYHIETAKAHVTIRFYGSSNGYYSESVSFVKTQEGDPNFLKKEPFLNLGKNV